MHPYEFVIDTIVLYKASEFCKPAITLLYDVNECHTIALDNQSKIFKQYCRCFSIVKNELVKKWWKTITKKTCKFNFYDGELPYRIRQTLFNNLSFDRDDEPFVAVASNTKDNLLVSEDSDYTSQIKNYLNTKLKIEVLLITDALLLSSPVKIP